ncbi:MAG: potassium channel family protein [Methanotrichaceae archaeon]|nr:potassium channel family protein [Methanotrichaceae archaeon]
MLFLFDFLYRFFPVESKSHYFLKNLGWADLLASIPFYGLRILRIFRTYCAYSYLSRNSGIKKVVSEFRDNRAQFAFYVVALAVILVLEIGGSWVLIFESQSPNCNIKNAGDALWWTYVTIVTVGYSDYYPVTLGGRLVGMAVMATGLSIYAVFTAYLASSFLSPKKKEVALQPDDSWTKLAEIKRMLEEEEKAHADFEARIGAY